MVMLKNSFSTQFSTNLCQNHHHLDAQALGQVVPTTDNPAV